MNRLTTCLLVAVGFVAAVPAADDIPPPRLRVDVAALVKQLGSEDFAEREQATKRLSTLDVDEVPPELIAALKSDNPEVRDRASRALKALREHITRNRERAAAAHLPRGERFAKLGRIDLYIASTAASDYKADDPRLWEPALDVGRAAIEKADMKGDRKPQHCPSAIRDFPTYKKTYQPLFVRLNKSYETPRRSRAEAIQSLGIADHPGFQHHIVVSRGPVRTGGGDSSLVLAAGDLDSRDDINSSVVICDGDVHVKGSVQKSLIIARGNITVGRIAWASTLVAGGTVTITTPPEPVRKVADPILQREYDSRRVVIEEKSVKPLGYITFFELSTVGVVVKVADGAVSVAKVADNKPFAAAGVKVGDVVAAVNGKKPDSPESLRRLLRDALALGDATLTLTRGDRTETVKVALPE